MKEFWLTGPVEGVHPLLTPAAHAFLQVCEEAAAFLEGLTTEQIWARVGASASIGYHAVHLAGATNRLLTYARGESLTEEQLTAARTGEKSTRGLSAAEIVSRVNLAMDEALAQLRATSIDTLSTPRVVGRKLLPSTTLGLISHAAEHAYRHAGQMATLRKLMTSSG